MAFLNVEGNEIGIPLARKLGIGAGDAKIDKPARIVEIAQNLPIKINAVLDECIPFDQGAQKACLLAFNHTTQARVGKGLVANKTDALNLDLAPFKDFKHQIDAIVAPADHFGCHPRSDAAILAIGLRDNASVPLGLCRAEHLTRFALDEPGKVFILDLVVTLKRDLVDRRKLDHADQKIAALRHQFHIFKKTRSKDFLISVVQLPRRDGLVARNARIGQNRSGFDPLVSFNRHRRKAIGLRIGPLARSKQKNNKEKREDATCAYPRRKKKVAAL